MTAGQYEPTLDLHVFLKHNLRGLWCKSLLGRKVNAENIAKNHVNKHADTCCNNIPRTQDPMGPHTNQNTPKHTIAPVVINSAKLHSKWFKNHYLDHLQRNVQYLKKLSLRAFHQSKNTSIAQREKKNYHQKQVLCVSKKSVENIQPIIFVGTKILYQTKVSLLCSSPHNGFLKQFNLNGKTFNIQRPTIYIHIL